MTHFEKLMKKANDCWELAVFYRKCGEKDLSQFWYNAGEGFKKKAKKLTYEEAAKKE